MRLLHFTVILALSLGSAFASSDGVLTPLTALPTASSSHTSKPSQTTPVPTAEPTIPPPDIPDHLLQFIMKLNAEPGSGHHEEMRKRQVGGVGGGVVGAGEVAPTPQQVSPITTYYIDGQQIVYSQKFIPTPDPWDAPKPGTIGLGTLTGAVGVVKTAAAHVDNIKKRGVNAAVVGAGLGGYLMM